MGVQKQKISLSFISAFFFLSRAIWGKKIKSQKQQHRQQQRLKISSTNSKTYYISQQFMTLKAYLFTDCCTKSFIVNPFSRI
jgi:hypothetical protein